MTAELPPGLILIFGAAVVPLHVPRRDPRFVAYLTVLAGGTHSRHETLPPPETKHGGIVTTAYEEDIRQAIQVMAVDPVEGRKTFQREWEKILKSVERTSGISVAKQLRSTAEVLSGIPKKYSISNSSSFAS